jgi:ABC-type branched-subunit amino acid transport system ATPase component
VSLLLEVKNLDAGYDFLQVLWDVSLNVGRGEYVCLVGPNGAGKSTTLKTIAGLLKPKGGQVIFQGTPVGGLAGNRVCKMGISYISEELNLFTQMSVRENLAMGAYSIGDHRLKMKNIDFVFDLFPRLKERQDQLAGTMSGGERKMLALGRGIMSSPLLLLVDEPSLGLAPQLAAAVFDALDVLRENGMTILLVEQNVTKSLQVSNRGYVLEKGNVVLQGDSRDLATDDHVRKVYLGV